MRNLLFTFVFTVLSMQIGEAATLTGCDLIKQPAKYNGATVVVHADVFDGLGHGILLTDQGCRKGLKMLASADVDQDEDFKEFYQPFYSNRRSVPEGQIRAVFKGRFLF